MLSSKDAPKEDSPIEHQEDDSTHEESSVNSPRQERRQLSSNTTSTSLETESGKPATPVVGRDPDVSEWINQVNLLKYNKIISILLLQIHPT